jgi:hypothetical protein
MGEMAVQIQTLMNGARRVWDMELAITMGRWATRPVNAGPKQRRQRPIRQEEEPSLLLMVAGEVNIVPVPPHHMQLHHN